MSIIHIKKMEQRDPKTKTLRTLYAVPSVSITSPQGKKKLIPNPAGMEAALFSTLEAAQQAVSLAGFDWEFEGKVHYGALHNSPSTHPMVQVAKKVFANPMDQARELLKTQLSDKEPSVVANAIYALGAMRAYDAQHELMKHLGHEDPVVRKQLAEALGNMGGSVVPMLQEAFIQAMDSHEKQAPYIRLTVINCFMSMLELPDGITASRQFLSVALMALEDESWLVRSQAAVLFGKVASATEDAQKKSEQFRQQGFTTP